MRLWTVIALGIAAISVGCGGGSGSSADSIPTSVPGSKRISDLTPAEEGQYCVDIAAWAMSGPFLTNGCNVDAWLGAYLQSTAEPAATDADLRAICSGALRRLRRQRGHEQLQHHGPVDLHGDRVGIRCVPRGNR